MNSLFQHPVIRMAVCVLCFCIMTCAAAVHAQKPPLQTKSPPAPAKTVVADPLGRDTPRGALIGFMKEAGSGNYRKALEYLDTNLPTRSAEQLAAQLYAVLNYGLSGDVSGLSTEPEGDLADGFDRNREQAGTIEAASRSYAIMFERVERGKDPPVWLFSPQTLRIIPELYRAVQSRSIDRYIPDTLKDTTFLKYPLWQWIFFLLIIPLSFLFSWLITWASMIAAAAIHRRTRSLRDGASMMMPKGPLRVLALALGFYLASLLSYTLLARLFWIRVSETLFVVGITWLCLYLVDPIVGTIFGRRKLTSSGTIAVSRLLYKSVKTGIVIIGLLVILYMAGINVTAVLTGLGIGGIAIAFAAQKTLENFFGGIMIVWDQPVRVGDFCRCDTRMGIVEDIGLRSTRLRTPDRTIVSIPNGQLAMMSLENFAVRDKILFHQKILLGYETSPEKILNIIDRVQHLIDPNPVFEKDGWVRFTGFRESGLEIEIWAYFMSSDYGEFQLLQQDVLLNIMEIIEKAGSSLAIPARSVRLADSSVIFDSRLKPGELDGISESKD